MSNNSHGCSKCTEKSVCTCRRPKEICHSGGCPEKIDASCVVYRPQGGKSYISCFLGLSTKTNYQEIIEKLDEKLCNLFTIETSTCVQQLLSVNRFVDFKSVLVKLLDYICLSIDAKVKISAADTSSGFLFDKIETVECLKKEIITAIDGTQTLRISIDYTCLSTKVGSCLEVNCCGNTQTFHITAPQFSVCGNSVMTIYANNCLGNVIWFKDSIQIASGTTFTGGAGVYYATCSGSISNTITITNSGPCPSFNASRTSTFYKVCPSTCTATPISFTKTYSATSQAAADALRDNDSSFNSDGQNYANSIADNVACTNCGCIPIWADVIPVNILCGQALNTLLGTTNRDLCTKYILQNNQCNNTTQWVVYTGSNSDGSSCPGCIPSQSVTNVKTFTRNNCPSGCTPGTYVFSRIYTAATLMQAQALLAADQAQFDIDGQNQANIPSNAACTNCPTICTPTGIVLCSKNATSITYTDSCGDILGVATMNNALTNCSSVSGQGMVIASYTGSAGFTPTDYLIEYAITAVNGSVINSPTYQGSNQFTGLIHNRTYTVTMRITRGGQVCYLDNSVALGDCTSCTQPIGGISITANTTNVCGSGAVTLSAASTNCNVIEWYRVNPATADLLVGTGSSITLNPTMTSVYEARCFNCNFGHVTSNTITIAYIPVCSGTCAVNVYSAGNLDNTVRTVFFDNVAPLSDYSYSADGGNTWNILTSNQLTVNIAGTYTYCVRKNSDILCNDCTSFTVASVVTNTCVSTLFQNDSGSAGTVFYTDCASISSSQVLLDGEDFTVCLLNNAAYTTTVSMTVTHNAQCTVCTDIQTVAITEQ